MTQPNAAITRWLQSPPLNQVIKSLAQHHAEIIQSGCCAQKEESEPKMKAPKVSKALHTLFWRAVDIIKNLSNNRAVSILMINEHFKSEETVQDIRECFHKTTQIYVVASMTALYLHALTEALNRDLTREEIHSVFDNAPDDIEPCDMENPNFQMPTFPAKAQNFSETVKTVEWENKDGAKFVLTHVCGDYTFGGKIQKGKHFTPVMLFVKDKSRFLQEREQMGLKGICVSLDIDWLDYKTSITYFQPTEGFDGVYLGPAQQNDLAEGFNKASDAFKTYLQNHPRCNSVLDMRLDLTLDSAQYYAIRTNCLLKGKYRAALHFNQELAMLPPDKDGDAKVTIARGGCQLHPTLSKGLSLVLTLSPHPSPPPTPESRQPAYRW